VLWKKKKEKSQKLNPNHIQDLPLHFQKKVFTVSFYSF
jgi:hypothetical protein